MGGLDAVIFTGGIGQGSAEVRALALQGLECMGIALDAQRNRDARGFDEVCRISADDSKVAVLVVPTDEERMMAREALRAISRSYITQVLEAQKQQPFLVEVSAHHSHLTQEHVEALFGTGHQLTKHADLSQPGQYACKEQIDARRAEGPHRARARARAGAEILAGRDRDDRAVQARRASADPRERRHRGHARLHARRHRPAACRSTAASSARSATST